MIILPLISETQPLEGIENIVEELSEKTRHLPEHVKAALSDFTGAIMIIFIFMPHNGIIIPISILAFGFIIPPQI